MLQGDSGRTMEGEGGGHREVIEQKELLLSGDCLAYTYFDTGTISCLLRDKIMPQMAAWTTADGLSCHHSALTAQLRNLWNASLPHNPTPSHKPQPIWICS